MSLIDEYDRSDLVCVHGHTFKRHPACFAKGKVRISKKKKEAQQPEQKTWYKEEKLTVAYLDIESDGLKADFSTMLSWCIKPRDGKVVSDAITKEELFNGDTDRRIVRSCIDEMLKYDIIVTYYGTGFDIPFLRAKALHYGMEFPDFTVSSSTTKTGTTTYKSEPIIYHFDLYFIVKSKFCISSKSLDNICDWLGIDGKTPLEKNVWRRGKYGDPQAIALILVHNKMDCVILEKLHKRIESLSKWIKKGL